MLLTSTVPCFYRLLGRRGRLALAAGVLGLLTWQPAQAQVAAPSRGCDVRLLRVTATSMELQFGAALPGQGRVVAMALTPSGVPVPLGATNNSFYAANPVFGKGDAVGKGYAVYCGPGNTVTVTGLLPSSTYYIASAEYNTDGTSIAYNLNGNSISTTTPAGSPLATTLATTRRIDVYPNPGTRQQVQLALQGYEHTPLRLSLTDALGCTLLTQTLTPTHSSYSVPLALPATAAAGTYVLTLAGAEEVIHQKIVLLD